MPIRFSNSVTEIIFVTVSIISYSKCRLNHAPASWARPFVAVVVAVVMDQIKGKNDLKTGEKNI